MKYFGTDGIRRKAEQFEPDFLYRIASGLVEYGGQDIKVLIGGDTRESSEWIIRDLEIAFETLGIEYGNVGVLPTPAINYCFFEMGFDFAMDVTASHNPYTDNGIKIFERGKKSGKKLSEEGRNITEDAISSGKPYAPVSPSIREDLHDEALGLYRKHLKDYIGKVDFDGLKIGLDCANGATSVVNKSIFDELGAEVTLINADQKYGTRINDGCGSTHLDPLKALVQESNLDFGIAFDGDGDRVLMIDEKGNEVDGDQIIAILANYLKLNKIVTTVMANQGLLNWAKDSMIDAEITDVGDYNVARVMTDKNISLGGEQSGHIILPGEVTGDGMLTGLMIAKIVAETHSTLSDLAGIMVKYPQILVNMPATDAQKKALEDENVKALLKEYEDKLEVVSGRLLVRPSGTEDLIRITMWGKDEKEINELANELKDKMGAIL